MIRSPSLVIPPAVPFIRRATPVDVPAIMVIEREAFADPWDAGIFTEALSYYPTTYFVAVYDGNITGFIVGALEDTGENIYGHICNFAVSGPYQRKGIGRRLDAPADELRLRRDRRRRRRQGARAARRGPQLRDAAGRPQLHGGDQHRPLGEAQLHVRTQPAPRREHGLLHPVGGARGRGHRRGRAARHRPLGLRLRRQQDRHLRQRPAPVLGAGHPHRRDPALPRVPSATPAASRRSPGGSPGGSRSSR